MKTGDRYKLAINIIGVYNRRLYGLAGTDVTIVNACDTVAIVEDENKERFPVRVEYLVIDSEKVNPSPSLVMTQPDSKRKSKPAQISSKPAAQSTQKNLFT